MFFSNHLVNVRLADFSRHMDARFSDMTKLIKAESARLEAVLMLDMAQIASRVKALDERAGLIYRP